MCGDALKPAAEDHKRRVEQRFINRMPLGKKAAVCGDNGDDKEERR